MADEIKDDLLGDIRAAMSENAGGDDGGAQTAEVGGRAPPSATDESENAGQIGAAQRARDEAGRFAKAEEGKARETLTIKEKPAAQEVGSLKADVSTTASAPPPALAPEIDKEGKHLERIPPPAGWKGAAKVDWDRMPRTVRQSIAADYAEVEQIRNEIAPLKELFDANREFLVNQAGSVVEAQRQMMQFAHMSVDNPVQLAEHILRARGLDPRAVFSGQPSQVSAQGQQPDQQALVAQLVQQQLQPILGQFQQQSLQQEISKVQAFRSDPAHPYFNDVASHIKGLLEAGVATNLQDAYDQAIWADPTIRQQLMSAQAEEAKKTHAAEVAKANQAKAASLRGSPIPGAALNGSGSQSGTVADDVRAAMAEIAGA